MKAMLRMAVVAWLAVAAPMAMAQVAGKTPEQAWAWYLANASGDDVSDLYSTLNDSGYVRSRVTAESCQKGDAGLKRAAVKVPVSLALHRALQLCAEARGDKAVADAEVSAFAALWKYAEQQAGSGAWRRPLRIAVLNDAYAALDAMGLEFEYEFYEGFRAHGDFPIEVVARDPESKVERHFRFDYLVAQTVIDRKNPNFGMAVHLNGNAREFIDAYDKAGELSARDVKAVAAAMEKGQLAERIAAMRPIANEGGLLSLGTWLVVCGLKPYPGCADGLVDALLPLAEKKQGMAMVLLSTAYRNGIGIARDEKAANLLLDAADNQWWQRGATVVAVQYQAVLHPDANTSGFEDRLARSSAAGNREAGPLRIALSYEGTPGRKIDAAGIAELSKPENNAKGYGDRLIAMNLRMHGDKAAAAAWEDKATAAGDGESSRRVAERWTTEHPGQPMDAATLALLKHAALEGDHLAMRQLAFLAAGHKQWREAELYLLPATIEGDVDAMYFLARLWGQGFKGVTGTPETARRLYEDLASAPEGAPARRELAIMTLEGRAGIPKDPAKARAMMERDARAGDADAQALYGAWLLSGTGGAKNVPEGRLWLDKALAAKSYLAPLEYGTWLIEQSDDPADHAKGVRLLEQTDAAGSTSSRNSLAWAYCTSRHQDLRAAQKGLQVAKRMQALDQPLSPGALDTVAACYAAAGEFDEAVRLQETVVTQARADGDVSPVSLKNMTERLALFKKHQIYIEPARAAP
ncbi:tetratricopeptide repeat protein [Solilutibacter silvestris]|uniref:tetratricopeptide repeat protein n=1 Tax=Solilutibacter silvestris TaxID=1645665 RepID=UPI003D34FC1B